MLTIALHTKGYIVVLDGSTQCGVISERIISTEVHRTLAGRLWRVDSGEVTEMDDGGVPHPASVMTYQLAWWGPDDALREG